jgi:hypothetical protein
MARLTILSLRSCPVFGLSDPANALLPLPQRVTIESAIANSELSSSVHPAVLQLGLRYADGSIRGGNARCVAMLTTFRKVIQVCKTSCSLPC